MTREEKHLHNDRLCHKCDTLQESKDDLITYSVYGRGYGSWYDNSQFEVQICRNCNNHEYREWFDEDPRMNDYVEGYQYEKDISDLINSFIIENQEYVLNGSGSYYIDREDWIAMKYGTLPDEKYEEYGMYSPRQIKAYKERFPTCEHPINAVFNDKSKGCYCPFGASGKYNQEVDYNISDECYDCKHYKKRETPIKDMDYDTYEKYKIYIQAQQYKSLFE